MRAARSHEHTRPLRRALARAIPSRVRPNDVITHNTVSIIRHARSRISKLRAPTRAYSCDVSFHVATITTTTRCSDTTYSKNPFFLFSFVRILIINQSPIDNFAFTCQTIKKKKKKLLRNSAVVGR